MKEKSKQDFEIVGVSRSSRNNSVILRCRLGYGAPCKTTIIWFVSWRMKERQNYCNNKNIDGETSITIKTPITRMEHNKTRTQVKN